MSFIRQNPVLESIEVISFRGIPPQFVGLHASGGKRLFIVNDMVERDDGTEIGGLSFITDRKSSSDDLREVFEGGRVRSCEYLFVSYSERVAGVRLEFADKALLVTSGDAPYSLFVGMGDAHRGRPESPLESYSPREL